MIVNSGQRTADSDRFAAFLRNARRALLALRTPESAFRRFGVWIAALGVIAILLVTSSGPAATAAEQQKPFASPDVVEQVAAPSAGSLAQVTLSLVLVLAAVFVAAWLVRRLRGMGRFGSGAIEIVADVALGPKERAVLVQVGGQQLLLGVTANQVNTLHVLAQPIARTGGNDQGAGDSQNAPGARGASLQPPATPDFKAILKRSFGL